MSNLRTSTRALTASGLLCFGTAALIAGCGGGGSSASPTPAITPGPTSGFTCAGSTGGVAYVPDGVLAPGGGSGGGGSLTIIPFETTGGAFIGTCPQTKLALPASINDVAISPQGIAIALQSNNTFIGIDQLVNGGSPNTFENSQPFPSPSGSPFTASSIAVVPNGNTGFAVGAPFQGFVGVNNLFGLAPAPLPTPTSTSTATSSPSPTSAGATPTPTVTQTPVPFAGLVSYSDVASNSSKSTGLLPVNGTRSSVSLASNGTTILTRGIDLATFSLVSTLAGYYFTFPADSGAVDIATPPPTSGGGINTTLGFPNGTPPTGAAGHGLIAYYPGDSSQAIIGQTSSSPMIATHVSNLPNGIAVNETYMLPAAITSVAVTPNDAFAIFGTTNGIYIANLGSKAPPAATIVTTGSIKSVGISPDGNFVVAQTLSPQSGTDMLTVYALSNGALANVTSGGTFTLPKTSTGDYLVVR